MYTQDFIDRILKSNVRLTIVARKGLNKFGTSFGHVLSSPRNESPVGLLRQSGHSERAILSARTAPEV